MTETRYRSNVGIVAVAILLLFAASALRADPAAGHDRGDHLATTAGPTGPTGPGGITLGDRTDRFVFDAEPIEPGGKLTTGTARPGFISNCFVDFNEPGIIQTLPEQAINTFVYWPFWTQNCTGPADTAIAVEPIGSNHYHLNYVDTDIRWCTDLGEMGRPTDPTDLTSPCDPIDPVTEPRKAIQPHWQGYAVRVFAYNPVTKDRIPFTMNQIRIVSGTSEVCFVRTDLPWITAAPTDQPAGYCGELETGNWDVSATVTDAYEVRIYSRSPDNSFTDIGLSTF